MIEKVQINQVTDGGTVVIHPETSSSSVLHEGGTLDKIVTIDGQNKQNFNFIPNEVVQDGLVEEFSRLNTELTRINVLGDTISIVCNATISKYGWIIYTSGNGTGLRFNENGDIILTNPYSPDSKNIFNTKHKIGDIINICYFINRKNLKAHVSINGETVIRDMIEKIDNDVIFLNIVSDRILLYNIELTPQEIQHNFSVLNNPQSISALETTSSDGTKVKHLFHSDSQVVSMRDGRTLNEFANEVLDWEEKTAVNGKIEVGNCKRAWLRNFSINGNTVKNIHEFRENMIVDDTSSNQQTFPTKKIETTKNTKYTAIFNVLEMGSQCSLSIRISQGVQYLGNVKLGINTITFTSGLEDVSYNPGYIKVNETGKTVKIAWFNLIEGDTVNIISCLPLGLCSTQAIVSNNGMKSVFYASEEDKVNKKVIELSKVGDVADTLTLNDDGSGTLLYNTSTLNPNINDNITFYNETDVDLILSISKLSDWKSSSTQNTLCNIGLYNREAWDKAKTTEEPISYCFDSGNRFFVRIKKTITSTLDTAKKYIIENLEIKYQLAVPITTHIPKELMQVVAVHQTNNLFVDSPVQPSSFKATIPVDKIALMEARLARIASIVDTPKNIALLDNYVEDEYNKNQKEEGVM